MFIPLTAGVTVFLSITSFGLEGYAASMNIGNGGVRFDRDTTLESEFVESHGAYQSTFGVVNLDTNEKTPLLVETKASDRSATIFRPSSKVNDFDANLDFRGTPTQAVTQTSSRFTFKAKANYVFYLESTYNGRPTGAVYSTDVLNPDREQQVTFTGNVTDLCQSGMILAWDDTGSKLVRDRKQQDRDFDDFIVRVRNTACPTGGGEDRPPVASEVPPADGTAGGGAFPPAALGLLGGLAFIPGGRSKPKRPPGAVPEPMTILGSTSALGFAALIQRRRKRRKKD